MSLDDEEKTELSGSSTAPTDDFLPGDENSSKETDNIKLLPCEQIKNKPYLGGYKNKITGVIFHNAATQTVKPPWFYGTDQLFNRDSQTVETKDEIQQTCRDVCTQVEVRNIFIQTSNDKFCEPSDKYITADEIQTEYLTKVILVQKYVRRWLAKRELRRRQQDLLEKLTWEEKQKKIREMQDTEFLRELQRRKLHPIKEEDFLLLFSDLQNWWENEAENISKTEFKSHQKTALYALLDDETKKISDIYKVKGEVENHKKIQQRHKNLIEAGKPKIWKGYKKEIAVVTDTTQKGKNLQDLYMTLSMKCLSSEDRISALQSLLHLLQKHRSNLTETLKQLAQREIDLLLRGTKPQNLQGLRSRIQDLFWQFVKEPMFNPQMHKQPDIKTVDGEIPYILQCAGCKQFFALPPDTKNEDIGKGVMGSCFMKCRKCLYLEKEGWIRKDVELYKKILKSLITEEEKKPSVSSIIYILQPCDIKHLVEIIWKRQSCLSGAADEKELELVRYNADEKWTPWNCMLVTREEAAILSGFPNPKESFDDQFKKFVYQRHIGARSYFATIPRFLPYVSKSRVSKDYDSSLDNEED